MLSPESIREMKSSWLPNITETGLDRLIDLLEKDSPLLIHGSFTRAIPMGCLATHAAWNHPRTAHLTVEAGICWLNRVAGGVCRDGIRDYEFLVEECLQYCCAGSGSACVCRRL